MLHPMGTYLFFKFPYILLVRSKVGEIGCQISIEGQTPLPDLASLDSSFKELTQGLPDPGILNPAASAISHLLMGVLARIFS